MSIPFTQYLRPHGRTVETEIDLDEATEKRAHEIIALGLHFECEELTNGMISLTITDREDKGDVAMIISNNGPGIPDAVKRLVLSYNSNIDFDDEV